MKAIIFEIRCQNCSNTLLIGRPAYTANEGRLYCSEECAYNHAVFLQEKYDFQYNSLEWEFKSRIS